MNPADQAQIASATYNAEMARRDAGNLMTSAGENAQLFTTKGEQLLAGGMVTLGKTGNLSVGTNAPVNSGISTGSLDTPEVQKMRSRQTELQGLIASAPATVTTTSPVEGGKGGNPTQTPNPAIAGYKTELDKLNSDLGILGPAGGGAAEVKSPEALLHASGSDLLTMVNTRDALERDKNTVMRNAQSEAEAMLKAGDQYDAQAGYAKQAAEWNTWSTLLSGGLKIAGLFLGKPGSV